MPDAPESQPAFPKIADMDTLETLGPFSALTEATLKYEQPATRQARETREAADAAHARLISLLTLAMAGFLLLGFFGLGVYLFAFKTDATEAQKLYASTVLTAIASGSAGYAFGKKEGKAKE